MAAAGFLLATRWRADIWLFLATLVGTALVIASACVFNNYLDREIDAKMARTKSRALVSGKIGAVQALIFASTLGAAGFSLLLTWTNFLAAAIAWVGFTVYVMIYSPLKRRTVYSTLIGSVAGAVPPAIGYTAATGRFDVVALALFLILVFWQMPHFYAIGIYRYKDYKAAGLPVLPVLKGFRAAKIQIFLYSLGFIAATAALTVFGDAGYVYLGLVLALGVGWIFRIARGFSAQDNEAWAKGIFLHSLFVIAILSILISIATVLP